MASMLDVIPSIISIRMPPDKVAIGFLNSDTTPPIVQETMRYIITGKVQRGGQI